MTVHEPAMHVAGPPLLVQVVPSGTVGFEQLPVAESHVPAEWHSSDAVHVFGVPAQ